MATITGADKLIAELRRRAAAALKDARVAVMVGYTANYALFVHENMEIHPPGMLHAGEPRGKGRGFVWDPQGRAQPKFLENPMREMVGNGRLHRAAAAVIAKGGTIAQGLLAAGLLLQRESQLRVPVDTGNLKASAFTRLEVP